MIRIATFLATLLLCGGYERTGPGIHSTGTRGAHGG